LVFIATLWCSVSGGLGCATLPPGRLVVDAVRVRGNKAIAEDEITDKIATQPSETLLTVPLDYEVYDPFIVQRDVQRIERWYRAQGFYEARVASVRTLRLTDRRVRVDFVVSEGTPILVTRVRMERRGALSRPAVAALAQAQGALPQGARFHEEEYDTFKQNLTTALTENGHAYAKVEGGFQASDLTPDGSNAIALDPIRDLERIRRFVDDDKKQRASERSESNSDAAHDPEVESKTYGVRIDAVLHSAQIYLTLDPGPICVFGEIRLEGVGDLPESYIRDTIGIRPGALYSTAELDDARSALLALGVFSSVSYKPAISPSKNRVIGVTFNVTPAPLRTRTLGGGMQIGVLQTDAHLVGGYEHANFLGGLRKLTLQLRPGLVLFPSNLQNLLLPDRVLPEVRSRIELRQPDFLESRTTGTSRTELSVYPFLLPIRSRGEVPDVVVGYREIRQTAAIDRSFLNRHLSLGSSYNIQVSYPFTYLGPLDEGLQRVLISHVSFVQTLDFRDDPIKPRFGFYLANEVQFAGGAWSGDADDVRVQPDARFYAPISKRLTLASRASVGFLFPRSYGNTLNQDAPNPITAPAAARAFETERNRDLQILFFRAFFSGGPNSNRGYPLRGIGPRGIAPFNLGRGTALRDCVGRVSGSDGGVAGAASQLTKLPQVDPDTCAVPLGGLSLWESSFELRYQLSENLGATLFLDASDVTRERLTLRFDAPRASTGFGLHYDTPVGPIRFDLGYAIPGLQRIGRPFDPLTEGRPARVLGLPIAINIAVGEAFLPQGALTR